MFGLPGVACRHVLVHPAEQGYLLRGRLPALQVIESHCLSVVHPLLLCLRQCLRQCCSWRSRSSNKTCETESSCTAKGKRERVIAFLSLFLSLRFYVVVEARRSMLTAWFSLPFVRQLQLLPTDSCKKQKKNGVCNPQLQRHAAANISGYYQVSGRGGVLLVISSQILPACHSFSLSF